MMSTDEAADDDVSELQSDDDVVSTRSSQIGNDPDASTDQQASAAGQQSNKVDALLALIEARGVLIIHGAGVSVTSGHSVYTASLSA